MLLRALISLVTINSLSSHTLASEITPSIPSVAPIACSEMVLQIELAQAIHAASNSTNFAKRIRKANQEWVGLWTEDFENLDTSSLAWFKDPSDEQSKELWGHMSSGDCAPLRNAASNLRALTEQEENPFKLFESYIKVFMENLDPHSEYKNAYETDRYLSNFRDGFYGVGANFIEKNDVIYVEYPLPGGSAVGVLVKGDQLIEVDETGMEGCDLICAIDLLRGEENTPVNLKIVRSGETMSFTLIRKKINVSQISIESEVWPSQQDQGVETKVGYIKLEQFYVGAEKGVRKELLSLTNDSTQGHVGIDALVFDLTTNGGGELTALKAIAGLFISKGVVAKAVGQQSTYNYEDPDPLAVYSGPMFILVSESTASSAEVFAGALQNYKRAIVIGVDGTEHTFGKGTIYSWQELVRMTDGQSQRHGLRRVTTHYTYLPSGQSNQKVGIDPDIILPKSEKSKSPLEQERDRPLALPQPENIEPFVSAEQFAFPKLDLLIAWLKQESRERLADVSGKISEEDERAEIIEIVRNALLPGSDGDAQFALNKTGH